MASVCSSSSAGIRVETADIETLIQKSFYTFQQLRALPDLQAELADLGSRIREIKIAKEALVTELHAAKMTEVFTSSSQPFYFS